MNYDMLFTFLYFDGAQRGRSRKRHVEHVVVVYADKCIRQTNKSWTLRRISPLSPNATMIRLWDSQYCIGLMGCCVAEVSQHESALDRHKKQNRYKRVKLRNSLQGFFRKLFFKIIFIIYYLLFL